MIFNRCCCCCQCVCQCRNVRPPTFMQSCPVICPTPTCVCGTVTSGYATEVGEQSATIANNTFGAMCGTTLQAGVQYSLNPDMSEIVTVLGMSTSPFDVTLTGLEAGTTYYFRAFVSTDQMSCFGGIDTFTTLAMPSVVITGNTSNITTTTATVANNYYMGIPHSVTGVEVTYATNPSLAGALTTTGAIGSPFAVTLTGLTPNTTYYYRATVHTAGNVYRGTIASFHTLSA